MTTGSKGLESMPGGRSRGSVWWYKLGRGVSRFAMRGLGDLRATGIENIPESGGALLVSNHASFLDVFALAVLVPRPLDYVARSTLFVPLMGPLIRSLGGFPIQRDGMGAQGFKETLRRLRDGRIVTLFPEGTRTSDGRLQPMKSGIHTLAARAKVSVIPAGLAGTFEAWPRDRRLPRRHPIHVHYGVPISPEEMKGLDAEAATELIKSRIAGAMAASRSALEDRGQFGVGRSRGFG